VLSGLAALHYHVWGDLDKAEVLFKTKLNLIALSKPHSTNVSGDLDKYIYITTYIYNYYSQKFF
jgi:hypothetical protein